MARGPVCSPVLDDADGAGPGALRDRFDVEGHLLAAVQAVEVAFGPAAVEEVFLPVLGCDKAEATVGYELFDGAVWHFHLLLSRTEGPTQLGGPVRENWRPHVRARTVRATQQYTPPTSPAFRRVT